jgi:hypothetical protein
MRLTGPVHGTGVTTHRQIKAMPAGSVTLANDFGVRADPRVDVGVADGRGADTDPNRACAR